MGFVSETAQQNKLQAGTEQHNRINVFQIVDQMPFLNELFEK